MCDFYLNYFHNLDQQISADKNCWEMNHTDVTSTNKGFYNLKIAQMAINHNSKKKHLNPVRYEKGDTIII